MWKNNAGAPPRRPMPGEEVADDSQNQPTNFAETNDRPDEGASEAQAGGEQGGQELDPDVASNVDPNDPVAMKLIDRIEQLAPEEVQAFITGTSPAAAEVLKKIIPEVAFLIDRAMKKQAPTAMPPGAAPPAPPTAQSFQRQPAGPAAGALRGIRGVQA